MFNADNIAAYRRDGYFLAKRLLGPEQVGTLLGDVDQLLCEKLPDAKPSSPDAIFNEIHQKILRLAIVDRPALALVYDAMRKLRSFWSLVGTLGEAARVLTEARLPGVIFRGCGIRLDLPDEDQWRSLWHQEYHSQMSSLDGVTAWFNLVPVTIDMGPVELLQGSHQEGLLPVRCLDPLNVRKNYAQAFAFADVEPLLHKYSKVQLETGIGDVLFLHFLTVHQSGVNRSGERSRITCQVRYFDMVEPGAVERNWIGGWSDNGDFTKIHPDKVLP